MQPLTVPFQDLCKLEDKSVKSRCYVTTAIILDENEVTLVIVNSLYTLMFKNSHNPWQSSGPYYKKYRAIQVPINAIHSHLLDSVQR